MQLFLNPTKTLKDKMSATFSLKKKTNDFLVKTGKVTHVTISETAYQKEHMNQLAHFYGWQTFDFIIKVAI